MAHWHALAKLRLHTDLTLEILDQNTTLLGKCLRDFHNKTCIAFKTKELPREAEARERRKTKSKSKSKAKAAASASEPAISATVSTSEQSVVMSTHLGTSSAPDVTNPALT